MKRFLLCFLLAVPCLVFAPRVFAQTADRIEKLLAQDKVSYQDAALLVLEAAGHIDSARQASADEAFSIAMERGWLPVGAEANSDVMLNGLSLLVMQAFEIDGGYLYSFFKNPHYAYRAMVYRGIIQGRSDPQMSVSGDLLLYTVNRVMNREQR